MQGRGAWFMQLFFPASLLLVQPLTDLEVHLGAGLVLADEVDDVGLLLGLRRLVGAVVGHRGCCCCCCCGCGGGRVGWEWTR